MKKLLTFFTTFVFSFTLLFNCCISASAEPSFRITRFPAPLHALSVDTIYDLSFEIPLTGRYCRIRVAPETDLNDIYYDFEAMPGITYTCRLPLGISHFWITTSNIMNEEKIYTFDSTIGITPKQWSDMQTENSEYRYFQNVIHLGFTINPDAMRYSAKESDEKDTSSRYTLIWNYDLVFSQYRNVVFGDFDGDKMLSPFDACKVLSYYVNSLLGKEPLVDYRSFVCGDIDGDDCLTPNDASLILLGYAKSILDSDFAWSDFL